MATVCERLVNVGHWLIVWHRREICDTTADALGAFIKDARFVVESERGVRVLGDDPALGELEATIEEALNLSVEYEIVSARTVRFL